MFARFTDCAVEVVNLAEREAGGLGSESVGAQHILLGLLGQNSGLGGQTLSSLGFSFDGVRRRVPASNGVGEDDNADVASRGPFERHGRPLVSLKFTPRARAVLERAVTEALVLGSGSIGTEHILLGLSEQHGSIAMRILDELDAELPREEPHRPDRELGLELRNAVIRAVTTSTEADHSIVD